MQTDYNSKREQRELCKQSLTPRGCQYGDTCWCWHPADPAAAKAAYYAVPVERRTVTLCRFQRGCTRPDCHFLHVAVVPPKAAKPPRPASLVAAPPAYGSVPAPPPAYGFPPRAYNANTHMQTLRVAAAVSREYQQLPDDVDADTRACYQNECRQMAKLLREQDALCQREMERLELQTDSDNEDNEGDEDPNPDGRPDTEVGGGRGVAAEPDAVA